MPEVANVVPGDPVASSWGNTIRDRTVQRYADATERDSLTPLPIAGDLAYLTGPQLLQVYDGAAWSTVAMGDLANYLPLTGGELTGGLTVIADPVAGDHLAISAPTAARVGINRQNVATQFRLVVAAANDGTLNLEGSPDGAVWTPIATFNPARLDVEGGVSLDTGDPQISDDADTRRLGLFSTFSYWSQVNSWLRMRVGGDTTTSYLMRLYARDATETPVYSFTESGIVGPTAGAAVAEYGAVANYADIIDDLLDRIAVLEGP